MDDWMYVQMGLQGRMDLWMDGWMEMLFQISNNRLIILDGVHIYVRAKALFFTATYSI